MQIKLTFRNETKKIRKVQDYEGLVEQARKSFAEIPQNFKFFYLDSDGDIISISSQDDFEEALECMQDANALKLVIDMAIESARMQFELINNVMSDTFRTSQMQAMNNPSQNQKP